MKGVCGMPEKTFKAEDFTEEELLLLKMAFALADTVVESQRQGNYDTHMSNCLYSLKEKLGIGEIVE